jgi:hypothetical protein
VSRWLEMSSVWHDVEPGGAPQTVSESLRPRFRRKPDHTVCLLPWRDAFPDAQRLGLSANPAGSVARHEKSVLLTNSDLPTVPNASCWLQLHKVKPSEIGDGSKKRKAGGCQREGNEGCLL